MQMQSQIILSRMEKRLAQQGLPQRQYYREALQELARTAGTDEAVASELYHFVTAHAAEIERFSDAERRGISDEELGGIGCLAMADWQFQQKRYDEALERYRRLYANPRTGWCAGAWMKSASALPGAWRKKRAGQRLRQRLEQFSGKYPGVDTGRKGCLPAVCRCGKRISR